MATGQLFERSQRAYIKLRVDGNQTEGSEYGGLVFQYYPETIQDSYQTNWNQKLFQGASHPVYFWESGGPRTITFTAVFTRESIKTVKEKPMTGIFWHEADKPVWVNYLSKMDSYNIDINKVVRWLRSLMRPRYTNETASMVVPPSRLKLIFSKGSLGDGLKLGADEEYVVYCIMTGCEVTYQKLFIDGTPRLVNVDLTFEEVVQFDDGIEFQGA